MFFCCSASSTPNSKWADASLGSSVIAVRIVPNERLVVTDAYTALVRHWTVADREAHETMGFHTGWGICADQLTALVTRAS